MTAATGEYCTVTVFRTILVSLAMLPAMPAHASPNIAFDSAVFIERTSSQSVRSLEPARRFNKGDRVVTLVSWHRMGGRGGFTVTNPIPRSIAFEDSARDDLEVSVNGGRSWGRLGSLRYGARLATAEDVTHLRWRISATNAMRGSGHIAYSGYVR